MTILLMCYREELVMPVPFLLGALGVAAGVIGAGGHLSAKETNESAQRISEEAQELYNNSKRSLEQAQNKTEKSLLKLGYQKKNVLDSSMKQFLDSYDKVKHIQVTESVGLSEISNFSIDQQGAIQLREMVDIYSSSIKSGATGVAAGAVVALAASGSLSVVTGGLATAGSALLAGEVTAAAGIAGSALSFGAAMTPLAAVAAPVVLFTGISASIKADENLEKANAMYAEAEAASEKMKISETLCYAISERSEMFDDLLINLNGMFAECSSMLAGVVRKKEGRIFKKKLSSSDFTEEELKLMAVTRSLAGAVKSVIDTPILSKDGNIAYESENVYEETAEKLPDFSKVVDEVKSIDYNAKPIEAKVVKVTSRSGYNKTSASGVLGGARSVFAFVLGFFVATSFAENIALAITSGNDKFLFLDSFTANHIACWVLICSIITMLIGCFEGNKVKRLCVWGNSIATFVLYVEYCRSAELMNHYIIFSVIFFLGAVALYSFFEGKKKEWRCAEFLYSLILLIALWPLGFGVYAFFSIYLGFSSDFWLVVTSAFMFLAALGRAIEF